MQSTPGASRLSESLRRARSFDEVDRLVDSEIFAGPPFVFVDDSQNYTRMVTVLAKQLEVSDNDIRIVGSAKTGFSLDPNKYPTPFGAGSDVDVLIVSARWFDDGWLDVLMSARFCRSELSESVLRYLDEHRYQHYIYQGWIWPDRITTCLSFGRQWFEVFRSLPKITGLTEYQFHGRLYRTWDHARLYHRNTLLQIQKVLLQSHS